MNYDQTIIFFMYIENYPGFTFVFVSIKNVRNYQNFFFNFKQKKLKMNNNKIIVSIILT